MLSTEKFYAAFDKAGFLRTATWRPADGAPALTAQVRYRAPSRDVLAGDQSAADYTMRYPASLLPGIKRRDQVEISGAGTFRLREDPESRLDGTELEAKLEKMPS